MEKTCGKPIDWLTQTRHGCKDRLRRIPAENERDRCDVPGCDKHRNPYGRFCKKHTDRARRAGDPVATIPPLAEIMIFERVIDDFRAILSDRDREYVEVEERRHVQQWQRPASWVAKASDMHKRVSQAGRVEIIKACMAKDGRRLDRFFVRALAVEGWRAAYFDGLPSQRKRFVAAQAGRWTTKRSGPTMPVTKRIRHADTSTVIHTADGPMHPVIVTLEQQYRKSSISGAVKAALGADALASARSIYGLALGRPGPFWEQTVETNEAGAMPLLDFAKHAVAQLRASAA